MELQNTLILDPADSDNAQKFDDFIKTDVNIDFIVLGNDANAQTLVEKANLFAKFHRGKIKRQVAWIKDHQLLKDQCLAYLKTFPDYDATQYAQTLGFTLSPKFHEAKYVFMNGDPIENFDVSRAYWKASLRERLEA